MKDPQYYTDRGCTIKYKIDKCQECPFGLTDKGECIQHIGLRDYIKQYRDKAIVLDWKDGLKVCDLIEKYKLSQASIWKILHDYQESK